MKRVSQRFGVERTLGLVLAHLRALDERGDIVVRPRVAERLKRLSRAPQFEDVDALRIEWVRSDNKVITPVGSAGEAHGVGGSVQEALPLAWLYENPACNDDGHGGYGDGVCVVSANGDQGREAAPQDAVRTPAVARHSTPWMRYARCPRSSPA